MGPPTASRSADGLVTLGGVCKNGTTVSGTVIATLPAEFSPGTDKIFAAVKLIDAMPVLCHIKITTSGDIETMPNVEQTFLGLDGITFDLHQI